MDYTSLQIRVFGILSFLFCFGNSLGQIEKKTIINSDNYYNYLLPDEKVFYLTDGEIKIILTGELRRLGFKFKDYHCEFLISDKTRKGKVILWLDVLPYLHGIFLDESKSFGIKDREFKNNQKSVFKCKEGHDPIELSFLTIKQSCYWYQQNKENQKKEFVTRAITVEILRTDIKKLTETINKK